MTRKTPFHILRQQKGFSLVETVVAMAILGAVTAMMASVFSFSIFAQQQGRRQMEAVRIADQVLESLRACSFEALVDVTDGDLSALTVEGENGNPIVGLLQGTILDDMQERLQDRGLSAYVNITPFNGREHCKQVSISITETGNVEDAHKPLSAAKPGEILVKMSTLVTRGGINP